MCRWQLFNDTTMAYKNQIIEHPVLGNRIKFLNTAEETKGEFLKYEGTAKVGALPPPEHFHPAQTETFYILDGEAKFKVDGKVVMAKGGEILSVPPNVRHTFQQTGTKELLMQVEFRPAFRTEFFLETFFAVGHKGKAGKSGLPKNFLQFAAMMNEFRGFQFIVGPPIFMQNFIAIVIGGFAKTIGYKGYIPYD
jgi:mannose-6-phosphate isomerase-like protein (cupin superfamily)